MLESKDLSNLPAGLASFIPSKASSRVTAVSGWALLLVVLSLLGWTFYTSDAWGQHPHEDSEIISKHPHQAEHPNGHHSFEDVELWSKRFDAPERAEWQKPREVVELMKIAPGMTVVDLGAGTGYFLGLLSAAVGAQGKVMGLDVEPAMVDFLAKRTEREHLSNVEVHLIQPDDPGLEGTPVDRILIVNAWHHITDRKTYSRKLRKSLTPAGTVLIVDFTHQSSHGPPVSQRLRPEEVVAELQAGGLNAQILEESLPDQYIVLGRNPN